MLPFMKKPQSAGVIVKSRSADEPAGKLDDAQDDGDDQGIEACASDILSAIESKDKKSLGKALKALFEICDSMPHEEGEHTSEAEPHSYSAQNLKARQE